MDPLQESWLRLDSIQDSVLYLPSASGISPTTALYSPVSDLGTILTSASSWVVRVLVAVHASFAAHFSILLYIRHIIHLSIMRSRLMLLSPPWSCNPRLRWLSSALS